MVLAMAGYSIFHLWILLVAAQSTLLPDGLLLRTLLFSASAYPRATKSTERRITQHLSLLALFSFGSDGSVSTVEAL